MPQVYVMMGSDSDREKMEKAADVLDKYDVSREIIVCSAHRDPERTRKIAIEAKEHGVQVIIAGAGLSAALPGVLASHTFLPIIGVPIASGALNGVDALYSITQMPPGVPVGCVGIDNAKNAALLAIRILALSDNALSEKLNNN